MTYHRHMISGLWRALTVSILIATAVLAASLPARVPEPVYAVTAGCTVSSETVAGTTQYDTGSSGCVITSLSSPGITAIEANQTGDAYMDALTAYLMSEDMLLTMNAALEANRTGDPYMDALTAYFISQG